MDDGFMIYNGNFLFHYTKFESALKIIASRTLLFSSFDNMNDIAEVKREVFGKIPAEKILKELEEYQSISFTIDEQYQRGFSIAPLWGYYAQKGNGVCLVFDKKKVENIVKMQFGTRAVMRPIDYLSDFSNAIFAEGNSGKEVKKIVEENIENIFFRKAIDWKFEQEYRILLKKGDTQNILKLNEDAFIAVILCLPKSDDYKTTSEYKILKGLLSTLPILHYTTKLGNDELLDEKGEKTCNIINRDVQLDV